MFKLNSEGKFSLIQIVSEGEEMPVIFNLELPREVESEELVELQIFCRLQIKGSPEKNDCSGEWTIWHYTLQRFFPSSNPTLPIPKSPGMSQLGVGTPNVLYIATLILKCES